MYRLAICDDEMIFLRHNCAMAGDVLSEAGIAHEIVEFASAAELEDALAAAPQRFDVLLLDILLGDRNGVDLARSLRETGYTGGILFVTSSQDYSLQGYSVYPIHYLLKPLQKSMLRDALLRDHAQRYHPPTLSLSINGRHTTVALSDILYIESLLRSVIIHAKDRDVETNMTLREVRALLPDGAFLQCHKSFIAPMAQIRDMTRAMIQLKCGQALPVGRVYYNDALSAFIEYMGGN